MIIKQPLTYEPGYESLASWIVRRAIEDYENLRPRYDTRRGYSSRDYYLPDYFAVKLELLDLERFFASEWFIELTDIDGSVMLDRIRREHGFTVTEAEERLTKAMEGFRK